MLLKKKKLPLESYEIYDQATYRRPYRLDKIYKPRGRHNRSIEDIAQERGQDRKLLELNLNTHLSRLQTSKNDKSCDYEAFKVSNKAPSGQWLNLGVGEHKRLEIPQKAKNKGEIFQINYENVSHMIDDSPKSTELKKKRKKIVLQPISQNPIKKELMLGGNKIKLQANNKHIEIGLQIAHRSSPSNHSSNKILENRYTSPQPR